MKKLLNIIGALAIFGILILWLATGKRPDDWYIASIMIFALINNILKIYEN